MRALTIIAMVGGAGLAAIGFTGSYSALVQLGKQHHFGDFSHVFPIGIDAGIVVLLALDLHMIRKGTPWPVVRLVAHLLTVATIVFNAAAGPGPIGQDPIGAAMHGILPVLFIVAVEAARKLLIKAARIAAGIASDGVPLHRWILSPIPSFLMFRRMKLWGITSYTQATALERERVVYRVMLDRKYHKASKAPSDARLPLTMARYGLSVDEALALPAEAEEAALLRAEQADARKVDAQIRADQRAADATIAGLRTQGQIEAAQHTVASETDVAGAAAGAARAEAEALAAARSRAAAEAAQLFESADAAEARKRAAEADEAAAETRARVAEAERVAAETEKATAIARRITADEKRREAEADALAELARLTAANDARRTAEAKEAADVAEARALEAEDQMRLKPTERAARRVARMILATDSQDPEQMDLQTIAAALGVSVTTASERRREAIELLKGGYQS